MELKGLGTQSRQRLSRLLRAQATLITPEAAAHHLGLSRTQAAHELSRWARAGWLARVRRGAYAPIALQATSANTALEDAWVVAESLFAPCYIGGWSAAEHWGLTEQIFRSVCVITASRPRKRTQQLRGTEFSLHSTSPNNLFGTQSVWRNRVRVSVSDPARTILDMLSDPSLGGGIRSVADMLGEFFREHRRLAPKLIDYGVRLENGAAFKRLGFMLAYSHPGERELIEACRANLTTGYAKLDPKLASDTLVTAWHLWIPSSWKTRRGVDPRP
jgi:predicted transcriptional regulator of viral defense system